MHVRVLYFGILREQAGTPEHLTDLPDGATVADLLRILRSQTSNPNMDALWDRLAVAVNREYSAATHRLREDDEVALLPPVSGGTQGSQ